MNPPLRLECATHVGGAAFDQRIPHAYEGPQWVGAGAYMSTVLMPRNTRFELSTGQFIDAAGRTGRLRSTFDVSMRLTSVERRLRTLTSHLDAGNVRGAKGRTGRSQAWGR
jgi:hypothetical protein